MSPLLVTLLHLENIVRYIRQLLFNFKRIYAMYSGAPFMWPQLGNEKSGSITGMATCKDKFQTFLKELFPTIVAAGDNDRI